MKRLDTQLNEPTKQILIKVPKAVKLTKQPNVPSFLGIYVYMYLPCVVVNGVTALEDLLVLDPVVLADGAAVDVVVEVESVLVPFDVLPMPPIS